MKRHGSGGFVALALVALSIALVSTTGRAETARRPAPRATGAGASANVLDKPYSVTLGQMIAASTSTILESLRPIDAPMMAIYNGQKIEIWVLGARDNPDGARETLEKFQDKAWPQLVAMNEALYGIKLDERQVTVVYRNREEDNREIIRFENGKYLVK